VTGDNRTVGICLMKSDEADATITHLLDVSPDIRVEDHVTYFRVMTQTDNPIELRAVSAYHGRDLPMPSFLVTLSAYFGQIEADDTVLTVSPVSPDSPNGNADGAGR
jgi:hypothetical protein